jgi:hypothetical protein
MKTPKAFISHSHVDKDCARNIATELIQKGVDTWFDEWEIQPGDSLIEKIFQEGLKDVDLFAVLLSPSSVQSEWVKYELDVALIQRLSGVTRVVPIIVEECDIPVALKALLWIDYAKDEKNAIRRLVNVAFGKSEKPEIGKPPKDVDVRIPSFSNDASRVAIFLTNQIDVKEPRMKAFSPSDFRSLNLEPIELNDAIEDLEAHGLVSVRRYLGTGPYRFGFVEPTYALWLELEANGLLDFSPQKDVLLVVHSVAARQVLTAKDLDSLVGIPIIRLNNAVSYIKDHGIANVLESLGSFPYVFTRIEANRNTRKVSNNYG